MSETAWFFAGLGLGAFLAAVVIVYLVSTLLPVQRMRQE